MAERTSPPESPADPSLFSLPNLPAPAETERRSGWADGARKAESDAASPGPRPVVRQPDGGQCVTDDGKGVSLRAGVLYMDKGLFFADGDPNVDDAAQTPEDPDVRSPAVPSAGVSSPQPTPPPPPPRPSPPPPRPSPLPPRPVPSYVEEEETPGDEEKTGGLIAEWREVYKEKGGRPEGYNAEAVRNRLLRAVPDARVFPVFYEPGRRDKEGRLSELIHPMGFTETTPGGMAVDAEKFKRAVLVGWVMGAEWVCVDVDDMDKAAEAGLTPELLTGEGGMPVLTPSGGFHSLFLPPEEDGLKRGRTIRPVEGADYLTGKGYIVSPYSWRPEYTAGSKTKVSGFYLPMWNKWNPVPLPSQVFRLLFPPQERREYDPPGVRSPRSGYQMIQDAAVRLRQAFPNISPEDTAQMIHQRREDAGFVPNEQEDWPWTLKEIQGRVKNAWGNRDDWEAKQPRRKGRKNRGKLPRLTPPGTAEMGEADAAK